MEQGGADHDGSLFAAAAMKPLVSILIPAYNAEPWISDTIRSALAQSWPRTGARWSPACGRKAGGGGGRVGVLVVVCVRAAIGHKGERRVGDWVLLAPQVSTRRTGGDRTQNLTVLLKCTGTYKYRYMYHSAIFCTQDHA